MMPFFKTSSLTRDFEGSHIVQQNQNIIRAIKALLPTAKEIDGRVGHQIAEEQLLALKKVAEEWSEFIDPKKTYRLTMPESKECHAFPKLSTNEVFTNLDQAIRQFSERMKGHESSAEIINSLLSTNKFDTNDLN